MGQGDSRTLEQLAYSYHSALLKTDQYSAAAFFPYLQYRTSRATIAGQGKIMSTNSLLKRLSRALLVIVLLSAAAGAAAWQLSPSFQEKVYLLCLVSGQSHLQEWGAKQLKRYPSKAAALSLIAFINLYAPDDGRLREIAAQLREIDRELREEELLPEEEDALRERQKTLKQAQDHEKAQFEQSYPERARLANIGVTSLCVLSGQSFGTHCEGVAHNFSHASVEKKEWSEVRSRVNSWGGAGVWGSVSWRGGRERRWVVFADEQASGF